MNTSDYIAIGSLIIAIIAFVYSYCTNTKKYELTSQYRAEILQWYAETTDLLVRLKMEAIANFPNQDSKRELLSKLSSKIEVGRFYFPNIDCGDGFGDDKPCAYRGYRNVILDILVFSYRTFAERNASKYISHAELLQRYFTSYLFEVIDPQTFLKDTKKHTNKKFSHELRFEDFISQKPNAFVYYLEQNDNI